jgi:hypothetical protein
MKIIILFYFIFQSHAFAVDTTGTCLIDPINEVVFKLAKEVNAACGWSINKIASESILKKCEKAGSTEGIKFTSTKPKALRFTQFNTNYDINDPYFFCKNKAGYEARLTQLVTKMTNEVDANSRKKYEDEKRKKNIITPPPPPVEKQITRWSCVTPVTKFLKPRIYTAEQKASLDLAHEGVEGYSCTPIKD